MLTKLMVQVLGHANQRASEEMYEVLRQTMQAVDLKSTIGYAIMFECIKTTTRIYPQAQVCMYIHKYTTTLTHTHAHTHNWLREHV